VSRAWAFHPSPARACRGGRTAAVRLTPQPWCGSQHTLTGEKAGRTLNLYGQYARWNGSHWRSGPQGLERQLAGSSPQDVWSAGFAGRAAHWDGRIWKDLEVPWTARLLA
jgi:hypothetical protein